MSQHTLVATARAGIITPSAGNVSAFIDLDKLLKTKDSGGFVRSYQFNSSVASQSPSAATRTYITGSQIALAAAGALQAGSGFRWRFNVTKTAAGVATSTIDIAFGTAGTTADTARVSFTKPAGTAAIDEGFVEIDCIVRSINATTGTVAGEFTMTHHGNTAGHMTIPAETLSTVSGNFDTTAPSFVGLCITSGAADVITIQQIQTEAWNI